MKSFLIAFVAVIAAAVMVGELLPAQDPDVPPHAARPVAARKQQYPGSRPGSSLEGIGVSITRFVVWHDAEVRGSGVSATRPVVTVREQRVVAYGVPQAHPGSPVTAGSSWDVQASCETGGNWHMQGPRFSGGLGFANSTWAAYGGGQFAPNAGLATREQQITVAERIQPSPPSSPGRCRGW